MHLSAKRQKTNRVLHGDSTDHLHHGGYNVDVSSSGREAMLFQQLRGHNPIDHPSNDNSDADDNVVTIKDLTQMKLIPRTNGSPNMDLLSVLNLQWSDIDDLLLSVHKKTLQNLLEMNADQKGSYNMGIYNQIQLCLSILYLEKIVKHCQMHEPQKQENSQGGELSQGADKSLSNSGSQHDDSQTEAVDATHTEEAPLSRLEEIQKLKEYTLPDQWAFVYGIVQHLIGLLKSLGPRAVSRLDEWMDLLSSIPKSCRQSRSKLLNSEAMQDNLFSFLTMFENVESDANSPRPSTSASIAAPHELQRLTASKVPVTTEHLVGQQHFRFFCEPMEPFLRLGNIFQHICTPYTAEIVSAEFVNSTNNSGITDLCRFTFDVPILLPIFTYTTSDGYLFIAVSNCISSQLISLLEQSLQFGPDKKTASLPCFPLVQVSSLQKVGHMILDNVNSCVSTNVTISMGHNLSECTYIVSNGIVLQYDGKKATSKMKLKVFPITIGAQKVTYMQFMKEENVNPQQALR